MKTNLISRRYINGALLAAGAFCLASSITSRNVEAQVTAAQSTQPPWALQRRAVDTARMAWGRKDFARYTSADACDRAIAQTQSEARRSRVFDTLPYRLESDTVFTSVQEIAQACGSSFSVDRADPRELWSVFRISLALDKLDQAKAVIARQLSLAKTPEERAEQLATGISQYLSASPPKLVLAQELLAQLDAMGEAQKVQQFNARLSLMQYWQMVYNTDSLHAYATAAVEHSRRMDVDDKDKVNLASPYGTLLQLANETQDVAGQEKIFNEALGDVGGWRDGRGAQWTSAMGPLIETRKTLYGKKTRPLDGKFWFNEKGTPRPVPGKMSLIVHVNHVCGERCFPIYTVVRELIAKYGDELDVTFITETRGFSVGTGPLEPEEEAKKAASYYLDFLKFPVAVLVDETPFEKLPDGRRIAQTSAIGAMFSGWRLVNTVLVDKEGRIQWLGAISGRQDERMIISTIERIRAK